LQVDIFVTKFKPIAAKEPLESPFLQVPQRPHFAPEPVFSEGLQPPHPSFARGSLPLYSGSSDSLEAYHSDQSDVDLTYYTGEYEDPIPPKDLGLAHDSHILELTNFDGDNDTALPGENILSRQVKKEGKLRRAQLRKVTAKTQLEERTVRLLDSGNLGGAVNGSSATSRRSMDKPLKISTNSDNTWSEILPGSTNVSPFSPYGDSPTRSWQSYPETIISPGSPPTGRKGATSSLYSTSTWDNRSEAGSYRSLLPFSAPDGSFDDIQFDVSEEEAQDINVIAEYARPGKPKLDRILADEVEQSRGPIVVACKAHPFLTFFSMVLICAV